MTTTTLYDFAAKVAEFTYNCPTTGIADYLRTRDAMMEAVIETMRQKYILPD